MLKPVLEDRFRLKHHREKRQMPVYFISPAPGGVQFRATVPGRCAPIDPNVGPPPPEQPLRPGAAPSACGLSLNQVLPGGGIKLTVRGITMADLARALGAFLDRPVVDRTGSRQQFDVDLSFMRNDLPVSDPSPEPSDLPSLFTALKKAGLSVTSGKDAVDVLVIDQLERPSEN